MLLIGHYYSVYNIFISRQVDEINHPIPCIQLIGVFDFNATESKFL